MIYLKSIVLKKKEKVKQDRKMMIEGQKGVAIWIGPTGALTKDMRLDQTWKKGGETHHRLREQHCPAPWPGVCWTSRLLWLQIKKKSQSTGRRDQKCPEVCKATHAMALPLTHRKKKKNAYHCGRLWSILNRESTVHRSKMKDWQC